VAWVLAPNMRVFALTALTMLAFAMNSILNRAAVDGGHADPSSFAVVRVLAGCVVLVSILAVRGSLPRDFGWARWGGGLALAVYMIGFSMAYISLDAGLGALILFGTVQIALFAHTTVTLTRPSPRQWGGAIVAFAGLALALWPHQSSLGGIAGAAFMTAAGLGWAAYTVAGRGAADPVATTASHFLLSVPAMLLLLLQPGLSLAPQGWALAILAGAGTSGLGYALWYYVLPNLPGARAAVVQLSVPVLAIGLGALLLGEQTSLRVIAAAILVLGGIGLALSAPAAPKGHK